MDYNVFVNLQEGDIRFSEVQLGDLGGCYPADSEWVTSGTVMGTPMWTSSEILLGILIYGGRFNVFRPKGVAQDDEEYSCGVIENQFKFFDIEAAPSILYLVQSIPREKKTPFIRITEKEVTKRGNVFTSEMMKLDWRDRPTAKELLGDDWWKNDERHWLSQRWAGVIF
ncbi:hypothetical protein GGP41_007380 [Bipolaris sorokiniana]|uniref:Protein kinase domain-containing protein n=1 Tax=Cochliobolus sativus TaxID=45130 RepID=A0A8H6E021_COCSA|nr:hypothetical protein GGP41_007380 [Bipolaris sorokiniana]